MTAVHVRLPNLDALGAVTCSLGGHITPATAVSNGGYLDAGWETEGGIIMYFDVQDVWDGDLGAKVIRFRAILGTLEDPATGSAASGLSSYPSLTEPDTVAKGGEKHRFVQGVGMGKRSEIDIKIALKAAGEKIESVQLQGNAVKRRYSGWR